MPEALGVLSEGEACIQALQGLESRYFSGLTAWAVILLTIITLGIGITQSVPVYTVSTSLDTLLLVIIYSLIGVFIYIAFVNLTSMFLVARLISTLLLNTRNTRYLALLAAQVLCNELEAHPYCWRPRNWDRNIYFKDLVDRLKSPIASCIHKILSKHVRTYSDMDSILGLVAAKIALVLERSAFVTGTLMEHPYVVAPLTIIASTIPPVLAIIFKIRAIYMLTASIMLLLTTITALLLHKNHCRGTEGIEENMELNRKLCGIGLDKASVCCFVGYTQYCAITNNIAVTTLIPSLAVTLLLQSILLSLALS